MSDAVTRLTRDMVHIHHGCAVRLGGFTLVETIITLVLSSILILLVSSTFLVQNNYYGSQIQRAGAQDNARAATELVAREIRSTMEDGVVVAGRQTLTIRSPIVLALICHRSGNLLSIHFEGGGSGLDTNEVAGIAVRDAATGAWDYRNTTWSYIQADASLAAQNCADNGANTTGAASEFHKIHRLQDLYSEVPDAGDVLMLFRETTFKIQTSELDPPTLGLFRGVYGNSLIEFVTGLDSTAQFQYRTGGGTYADTVLSPALGDIDVVRIVAEARKRAQTGGRDDITFGWSVNVALRNVR